MKSGLRASPPVVSEAGESITLGKIKEARAKLSLSQKVPDGISLTAFNAAFDIDVADWQKNSPFYTDWLIVELERAQSPYRWCATHNRLMLACEGLVAAGRTPVPVAQSECLGCVDKHDCVEGIERNTAYNAGVIHSIEREVLGPVERERYLKAPAWTRSLITALIRRIANLRTEVLKLRSPVAQSPPWLSKFVANTNQRLVRRILNEIYSLRDAGHGWPKREVVADHIRKEFADPAWQDNLASQPTSEVRAWYLDQIRQEAEVANKSTMGSAEGEEMSTKLVRSDSGLDFHLEAPGRESDEWRVWVCCEGGFSRDGFIVGLGETRELAISDAELTLSGGAQTLRSQL